MTQKLRYLSDDALKALRLAVPSSLDRYRSAGFDGFSSDPGWDISLGIEYDSEALTRLQHGTADDLMKEDFANSLLVGEALAGLSPALANEERVWARLAHLDALPYVRSRWLDASADLALARAIEVHVFAPTQTGIRDDHGVSRLWWNYHIASACMPHDPKRALRLMLATADIRSNFVERLWMTSRRSLAGGVLRAMDADPRLLASEAAFRSFMKMLNRLGGGIVFEALDEAEVDLYVRSCAELSVA